MKPPKIALLAAMILVPVLMNAQPYQHAAGVRVGFSWGITYKGFFTYKMTAVEVDAYYNPHGLNVSALYVWHREPFRNSRWLVYFGGGIFGGNWKMDYTSEDDEVLISAGITGIAGIEYSLRDLPLVFGLDWKPQLMAWEKFDYELLDFGVTIRYRFGR